MNNTVPSGISAPRSRRISYQQNKFIILKTGCCVIGVIALAVGYLYGQFSASKEGAPVRDIDATIAVATIVGGACLIFGVSTGKPGYMIPYIAASIGFSILHLYRLFGIMALCFRTVSYDSSCSPIINLLLYKICYAVFSAIFVECCRRKLEKARAESANDLEAPVAAIYHPQLLVSLHAYNPIPPANGSFPTAHHASLPPTFAAFQPPTMQMSSAPSPTVTSSWRNDPSAPPASSTSSTRNQNTLYPTPDKSVPWGFHDIPVGLDGIPPDSREPNKIWMAPTGPMGFLRKSHGDRWGDAQVR